MINIEKKLTWIDKKGLFPSDEEQVMTFSPVYPKGNYMRFRVMEGRFVKICLEVTHWLPLDDIDPTNQI